METIRISERKVKIMLTEDDLSRYDLSLPVDVATDAGRFRMRRLIRDACGGEDFDPDSGRIYVQIYESARGGCELFVTRRESSGGGKRVMMTPQRSYISRTRQERGVYAFPDLESLLAVCGRLAAQVRAETSAYAGDGGRYYLLTYEPESKLDAICGEYGGERCLPSAEAYLSEHCSLICEKNAAAVLGALF